MMLCLDPTALTQTMLTLPLTDAAWLLELASALDEAIDETEDDSVHIDVDLAVQISKHLKVIIQYGTTDTPN